MQPCSCASLLAPSAEAKSLSTHSHNDSWFSGELCWHNDIHHNLCRIWAEVGHRFQRSAERSGCRRHTDKDEADEHFRRASATKSVENIGVVDTGCPPGQVQMGSLKILYILSTVFTGNNRTATIFAACENEERFTEQ